MIFLALLKIDMNLFYSSTQSIGDPLMISQKVFFGNIAKIKWARSPLVRGVGECPRCA